MKRLLDRPEIIVSDNHVPNVTSQDSLTGVAVLEVDLYRNLDVVMSSHSEHIRLSAFHRCYLRHERHASAESQDMQPLNFNEYPCMIARYNSRTFLRTADFHDEEYSYAAPQRRRRDTMMTVHR